MNAMLERIFRLKHHQTTIKTELAAGVTTFVTMSYIIFVQPAVLSVTGMDFGSVMTATCLASAFATLLMGLYANYPIALAPAMGHNFYFAFIVCGASAAGGMGLGWQTVLGAVFISGLLFVLLTKFGFREMLLNAIPESLKHAIAVGIGLLIAFVGLQWAGIVVAAPGILVSIGNLKQPPVMLALFGLVLTGILYVKRVKGALLLGVILTALAGLPFGIVKYQGIFSLPPSIAPTFLKLELSGIFTLSGATVIAVFFFLALFDTIGTLVGVSEQAGLLKNGKLPRAEKALLSDSAGMTAGALLGTSTITSYIESAAGVASGGRTGLSNMATGALFILALFISPLAKMIGGGYEVSKGMFLYPVIAPVLIIIGSIMLKSVRNINWEDTTEAIPAFLTIIIMLTTVSITEGIAFGFISYVLLKLVTRRTRDAHWLVYMVAVLFIARYIFL
ncbi:MAG: NCS2 family permease [Nitrospiraceae bacterium]|nr:NCS2 family permease [Nitrospiraceae bacterium]